MNRRAFLYVSFLTCGIMNSSHALAAGAPKKKTGGEAYTPLPMIILSTRPIGARRGNLSVEAGLYCEDLKMADKLKAYMPRLTDAYMSSLQAYAMTLTKQSIVDMEYVLTLMQKSTDTVLGKKGVKVLLGSVVVN